MFSLRKIICSPRIPIMVRKFSAEVSEESGNMERSLNHVQLIGRSGNEPQKRGSDSNPVVIFSLATNSQYKNESGMPAQKIEWHRISVFKPVLRDMVFNYLKKGQRVFVSGRLSYGEVTDETTGRKLSLTSIIADDIIFFSPGK